ncbi:MAG TPA: hypothetical protein VMU54_21125 [Planctomycetota bacterium]|nr:hypothetical protein [Planctomycetota bacterium]
MKKIVIVSMLSVLSVGMSTPTTGLVVHEWGTFTTVAGRDGAAVDWRPLLAPDDLPSFVYGPQSSRGKFRRDLNAKFNLSGLVRMETPVIYFYAEGPTEVSAKVEFPRGNLTEWYPAAKELPRGLDWGRILVDPGGAAQLPRESRPSHYYPARETDAAPLRVGNETEKLLFYRGVGSFALPVQVTLDGSTVTVINPGRDAISRVFVLESRGGKVGFRTLKDLKGEAKVDRPQVVESPQILGKVLERSLVEEGLFEKEAAAMVKTWQDSWFEDGLRVFYLVPVRVVGAVLPLTIDPKPAELVRVFVGRVELITTELEKAALATVDAAGDLTRPEEAKKALSKLGRFGEPALRNLLAASSDPAFKSRALAVLAAGP